MKTIYLRQEFTAHIPRNAIHTIFECGSRDCLDALALQEYYKPDIIYAFECNPESIAICQANVNEGIHLIQKAVHNITGIVDFYATDMEQSRDKNIGASSLLIHAEDGMNGYIQKKISVEAIRLDHFMKAMSIPKIDLLCMDLQGAEPLAIEGLGERSKDVRFVISEITNKHYYHGDVLFDYFNDYMADKGFKILARAGDDALYEHT